MGGDGLDEEIAAGRSRREHLRSAMTALETELAGIGSRDALEERVAALQGAFDEHRADVEGPGGLLAELADGEPGLRPHLLDIREEHTRIADHAGALAAAIHGTDRDPEVVARIHTLLTEIMTHSQDLVAFAFDGIDTDIPAID